MKETEGRKEDQKEQRKIEMIKEEHVKSFMYMYNKNSTQKSNKSA